MQFTLSHTLRSREHLKRPSVVFPSLEKQQIFFFTGVDNDSLDASIHLLDTRIDGKTMPIDDGDIR